jgi:anti-anti-sigma factor
LFKVTLEMSPDRVAHFVVEGELDAAAAPRFQETIAEAVSKGARRLVLDARGLAFLSSAGIRVLVFARQKMGPSVDVHMIGACDEVLDTLRMTGVDRSLVLAEQYEDEGSCSP